VACKDWHDIPAGSVFWRRVITREGGKFPNIWVRFLSSSCHHCGEPACERSCPVGAISKRKEDGIVIVNREYCLGITNCGDCLEACPYRAPQFKTEVNARMEKCDLCLDRWAEGKKPVCVEACPTRALDAGPLNELMAKYRTMKEVAGFTYNESLKPSIIFRS
jgi:anaerobic dimethyl sulfoxide reductase subunit B (iron-sulfur subunit)